jgi:hypothetical protein
VFLSLVIIASLLLLGVPLLIFVLSVFLFKRAYPRDRMFLAVCMALSVMGLAVSVLDDVFVRGLSPDGSFAAMRLAIDEGYSVELEEKTAALVSQRPNDHVARIALATILLKKNDALGALSHATTAQQLVGEDPVVLLTAGNACYAAGKFKSATMYFRRCIDEFPGYEAAYYNLARCLQVSVADGSDSALVAAAIRTYPASVTRFISENRNYYGADLPLMRQFMPADYAPIDFWRSALPQENELAKRLWTPLAASYHGIPVALLGVIAVLLVLLVVLLFQRWWHARTENRATGLQGMRIVMRSGSFLEKKGRDARYLFAAMEILFPGASDIVRVRRGQGLATVLLILSSIVWATYVAITQFVFAYPHWVVHEPFQILFAGCGLYTLVGAARAIVILVSQAKS